MLSLWVNTIASGVLMGVVYGLIALGLTIIFGVMRVVNFAHGEMVVIGAYIGYWSAVLFGLPVIAAAVLAAAIMFCLGYVLQKSLVQHFVNSADHLQFIVFIGLAVLITGVHLIAFGPDPRPTPSRIVFDVINIGPLRLDVVRVQAAVAAAVLMVALWLYLRFSSFGRCVRAAADNRLGGLIVGLNIPRIYAVTAGIGIAYAGTAGALISPMFDVHPYLAVDFTLLAFVIVIVGGLGSFMGAVVAGVLVGVAESVAALLIAPSLKSAVSYMLLIAVLLFRPKGLFGAKS